MVELEKRLGYTFNNKQLLKTALTHTSYANEHRCESYERLEFLGDSILSIIVSEYLYNKMKKNDEGDLSRIRAQIVCEDSLASLSRKIGLGEFLLLGKGDEKLGSRNRDSILSDIFEAVLAAVYLDSNIDVTRDYLIAIIKDTIEEAIVHSAHKDYKTTLQEVVAKKSHGKAKVMYKTVGETGPEHMKTFYVELLIDGKKVAEGSGSSKKEAEREAAKKALKS